MNSRKSFRLREIAAWADYTFLLGLVALATTGCIRPSRLDLVSFKDPYFPEKFTLSLDQCVYREAPGGDFDIVGHAERPAVDNTPASEQFLHIHLFWKPRPGKTYDNPSSVDAIVRYTIVTPNGTRIYSGAGYAYPERPRFGPDLLVKLESARLRPADGAADAPDEILGETRATGTLAVTRDDQAAVDLIREAELVANTP